MDKRRWVRLGVLAIVIASGTVVAKRWPKDHAVHYVLGDAAPQVEEVNARWAEGRVFTPDTWLSEVTYHYPPGQAPRIATQELHVADGKYTVEIVILANQKKSIVRKELTLSGGPTSIDLEEAVTP